MKLRKHLLLAALIVATLVTLAMPLGTTAPVTAQGDEKPTVGLVMKSLGAEFFKNMEEGAIAHANERGDLELIPLGTQTQEELDQQISLVENLITQQVDAIVIAPMDSRALIPPLADAVAQGIKVINIDVMLDQDTLAESGLDIPFLGPDNIEAAKMVGDVLADELGEGGKVIIIEGIPGALNAQQRKEGFMQAIDEGGLELLTSNTANWEIEEAFTVFSDLLTRYPDVQGVMAANDAMALGVVQAIDAAGLTGQIKVVGFDNDPSIRPLIDEGKVLATVEQFGSQQAALGIDAAMEALDGKTLEDWVKTPVVLVTKDNVNDEDLMPQEEPTEQATIGLVMKSLGAEFFKNMEEGAIAHAAERGDVDLIPLGTQTQEELDQQISLVENLITQQVDAIVIAPMDSRALVPPLVEAMKQGITVVNIDVMLDDATMQEAGVSIPFLGPDNVEAAKMVGDVLADELGEGGKVIIIEGIPGALNAQQRKEGFMQAIDEGGLELLTSNTANWEIEEAFTVFSDLLTRYPDVQGVMAANDAMALGVVQAIDAAGLTGQIKVVGFDNDPSIRPLIAEGKVLATIDQFGSDMAALGIDAAMQALSGEELDRWVKTPTALITADNVELE